MMLIRRPKQNIVSNHNLTIRSTRYTDSDFKADLTKDAFCNDYGKLEEVGSPMTEFCKELSAIGGRMVGGPFDVHSITMYSSKAGGTVGQCRDQSGRILDPSKCVILLWTDEHHTKAVPIVLTDVDMPDDPNVFYLKSMTLSDWDKLWIKQAYPWQNPPSRRGLRLRSKA